MTPQSLIASWFEVAEIDHHVVHIDVGHEELLYRTDPDLDGAVRVIRVRIPAVALHSQLERLSAEGTDFGLGETGGLVTPAWAMLLLWLDEVCETLPEHVSTIEMQAGAVLFK